VKERFIVNVLTHMINKLTLPEHLSSIILSSGL